MDELTHASFFSGIGGLDLGLERAGWRTVSFSEIDPYASAVLAERWPGIRNLGDIVALAEGWPPEDRGRRTGRHGAETVLDHADAVGDQLQGKAGGLGTAGDGRRAGRRQPRRRLRDDWRSATLWSGGFPCQDLSIAGKRRGFGIAHGGRAGQPAGRAGIQPARDGSEPTGEGIEMGRAGSADGAARGADAALTRSGLAFAFLDLVGRHHPRWILLENVPGLLSSHKGRDMAALLQSITDLGYGVAWRVLDARYYGVPQRRRRVFILATNDPGGRAGAIRAAEVLAVAASSGGYPPPGGEEGQGIAAGARGSPARPGRGEGVGPGAPADAGRVRAPDGPAGRMDDREQVETFSITPEAGQGADLRAASVDLAPAVSAVTYERNTDRGIRVVQPFTKARRAQSVEDNETWVEGAVSPTLNRFDVGDTRATVTVVQSLDQKAGGVDDNEAQAGHLVLGGNDVDDPLLPKGLDSHRYRANGNAVVVNVAYAIGLALAEEVGNAGA